MNIKMAVLDCGNDSVIGYIYAEDRLCGYEYYCGKASNGKARISMLHESEIKEHTPEMHTCRVLNQPALAEGL